MAASDSTHTAYGRRLLLMVINAFSTPATSAPLVCLREEGLSESILDLHSDLCANLISNKMGSIHLQNGISSNRSSKSSRGSGRYHAVMPAQNDELNNPRALSKLCRERGVETMRTYHGGMSVHGIRRILRT